MAKTQNQDYWKVIYKYYKGRQVWGRIYHNPKHKKHLSHKNENIQIFQSILDASQTFNKIVVFLTAAFYRPIGHVLNELATLVDIISQLR